LRSLAVAFSSSEAAMRASVGIKLGLWLALLGIASNAFTGYYIYMQSREMLTRAAERKLLTATQVLARRIEYSIERAVNEVRFLAALPLVARLADPRLQGEERRATERMLEETFASMLASHPDYFEIAIIDAGRHGRERIRVERGDGGIKAVRGNGLQEKGYLPYVADTLQLPLGELYFSPIHLDRERGTHRGRNKPTLRIATPVHAGNDEVFGLIMIGMDLEDLFTRMGADIPDSISVFLTDQQGDYLIHPDPAKTFGFDNGRRFRIQQDIPQTAPMFDSGEDNLVLTVGAEGGGQEAVGTFTRVPFGPAAGYRFMLVGLAWPLDVILRDSRTLGLYIIRNALLLSALALIVSMVLSRLLTQPLNAMAHAVGRFEAGKPLKGLPVERNDEIGYLAQAFQSMMARLNSQVGALQNRQMQLDYLAHHDPLTQLPNRVLFFDRLIQAVNKAHRNKRQFAVMFIDLDKFKEINDGLGHHVGDEVLKIAAARMQSLIRQEDTISRLGGDEFTIILQDLHHAEQYAVVAEKLLALFAVPFEVGGHRFDITCSIGISIYPLHGTQAQELLEHADTAMYRAKKQGRNNYQLFGG
jgi:diguanylate cyclase (GGDEF)-like protein